MTKTLGPYTLVARLGEGGMAEVFKAVKGGPHGFEKIVAIKKILPPYRDDQEMVAMFLQEARLHALVSHPNLVQLIDFFEVDQGLALVMEYFKSKPLSRILADAKKKGIDLPWPLAAGIALSVLDALGSIHRMHRPDGPHSIIHRDISPQNILISFDGWVKLTDFGIAKTEDSQSQTRSGVLKGKIRYLSPEQIRKDNLSAASDLFSLAIVLYEMVCKRHPFSGKNEFELMKSISSEAFLLPDFKDLGAPENLGPFFSTAFAKNPEERFSSAGDMKTNLLTLGASLAPKDELHAWLQRLYVASDFDSDEPLFSTRVIKQTPRRRTWAWVFALLSIGLLPLFVFFFRAPPSASTPPPTPTAVPATPSVTAMRFDLQEGESLFINGRRVEAQTMTPIETPPGRYLVLILSATGKKTVRTVDLHEGENLIVRADP